MSLYRFQRQRQLVTSIVTNMTALLLCCVVQEVDASPGASGASSSVASSSVASSSVASVASGTSTSHSQTNSHRRLNNQRVDCPVGVAYCDNPFDILVDPTVACDEETCAWLLTLLDPTSKPVICRSIQLVGEVPDFLEPCLWWELLYGGLKPTPAPSVSLEPTPSPSSAHPSNSPSNSPSDSLVPTSIPSLLPSLLPSVIPSDAPSLLPSLQPSNVPSIAPSDKPSASSQPSSTPTLTPSLQPSVHPSLTASGTPVATPSDTPSMVPSLTASNPPTGAPSPVAPTAIPTIHPSAAPSNSMAPTSVNERNVNRDWEQPILLNYFVVGAARSSPDSEDITLIGGNLRGRQLQTAPQTQTTRTPLELLTAQHLLQELRQTVTSQNADADQVVGATVTVSPVKEQTDNNASNSVTTTVTTHAVTGSVLLQPALSNMIRTSVLRQMVDDAFTGAALDRYVIYLGEQSASFQQYTSLRGVVQVTAGLPPDWSNGNGNAGDGTVSGTNGGNGGDNGSNTATGANAAVQNGNGGNNATDEEKVWSDNLLWIAVIAGAGAAAIGLVVAGLLLVRRGRNRNESYHDGTVGIADKNKNSKESTGKGGGGAAAKNDHKKYKNSPSSTNSSSPNSMSPGGTRRPKRNNAGMESVAEIDDDGTSFAENSLAGGDQASAATSVYSYIDANLMDEDQSIAQNSFQGMYGPGMAGSDLMDDQSLQSMSHVWSSTKGGGTGDYYNGATGAARNGDQLQVYDRDYDIMDDDDANTLGSNSKNAVDGTPSRMVVTAEGKKNGNGFFIFADDGDGSDDDLSMVSDAAKAPSIPPPSSSDEKRKQRYPQLTENKREREKRLEQAAMMVVGVVPKEKAAAPKETAAKPAPVPVPVPASSKVTATNSIKAAAARAAGKADSQTLVDPLVWGFDDYMNSNTSSEDEDDNGTDKDDSQEMANEQLRVHAAQVTKLRRLPLGALAPVDESSRDAESSASSVGSSSKHSLLSAAGAKENALKRVGWDDASKESEDDSQYTAGSADDKEGRYKQLSPVSGLQKYHGKSSINTEDKASLASQGNRVDCDDEKDDEEESLRLPSSYSVGGEKKEEATTSGQPTIAPMASF